MPHCPSCGKLLKDHTSVACHMSQPRSGCNTCLDDLIRLNTIIPPAKDHPMDSLDDNEPIPSHEPGVREEANPHDFYGEEEDIALGEHDEIQDQGKEAAVDYFPDPPLAYQDGYTFLNLSRRDWQIDSFLSLDMIKDLPFSFCSAKELRGRAEMLPSGPCWMSKIIPTSHPTKSPVVLYWRDPLECIATLFNHPLFHNRMDFTPRKVYTTAEKQCRVYTEWMTGNDAWNMQSAIPSGATLLGTILSSDKTNITALTGDRSSSFVLTALLPVPKFIHKKKRMKGVLEDRLIHQCLDIVLDPLKQAARRGVMLSDPAGKSHYCFTALASYIADTPEAMMLATVGGKTSPVTMAMYTQFGDDFQHEPRTKSMTLAQLAVVHSCANPLDLEAFFREVQKFHLNGVAEPFYRDWILAEPSHFFTPESLHHHHKQFFDHDAQWLICAVGESEINFRFSILQPITGYRHFPGGISKLKQVTGHCQRDIQRYIIAVCADAAPPRIIIALRALMQFRYLAQSPRLDDDDLEHISSALREFHAHKDTIIDAGVRRGKGNRPIIHWHIPKLELMQSVVSSIRTSGVTAQWSADITEHAHITEVKDPAKSGNNREYDPQICRHLDRAEKCHRFELATSLLDLEQSHSAEVPEDVDPDDDDLSIDNVIDAHDIPPELSTSQQPRLVTNYFVMARALQYKTEDSVPVPLRSFSFARTTFHLGYHPSIRNITVDEAAIKFGLPDLRPAIADFLQHEATHGHQHIHAIGGPRRSGPTAALPFNTIQVWFEIRLQETDLHNDQIIKPAQTLNCTPPNGLWTLGRYDTVIVATNAGYSWPSSLSLR
ncbi:hypothetical protein DFH29DRAFT_998586 [Suillus ampliporus]|nr:hypothetical protein DFH29DRAFT_998586 [Suillus ampliporus]